MEVVPQADFKSLKFISPGELDGEYEVGSNMLYNGPNQLVERMARSTASAGSVPSVGNALIMATNASWELTFSGPYLKCGDIADDDLQRIQQNILIAYQNGSFCQDYQNYLSWTATPGVLVTGSEAFDNTTASLLPFGTREPFNMNVGTLGPYTQADPNSTADLDPNAIATIYFAAIPDFYALTLSDCEAINVTAGISNSTFLQCGLYNTTYHTSFAFSNGIQDLQVDFPDVENAQPLAAISRVYLNNGQEGCTDVNTKNDTCDIDPSTLEQLSFQAVMDAFGRVLVGSIHNGDTNYEATLVEYTSVLSTSLVYTPELSFLSTGSSWQEAGDDRYQNGSADFQSLYSWQEQSLNLSLADALEQLFQNITLSMLSLSEVQ